MRRFSDERDSALYDVDGSSDSKGADTPMLAEHGRGRSTVAPSSRFNSNDADAALVRASPAIKSTGPMPPPATTAISSGRAPARSTAALPDPERSPGA